MEGRDTKPGAGAKKDATQQYLTMVYVLLFLWTTSLILHILHLVFQTALKPSVSRNTGARMPAFNIVFTVFSGVGFILSVIPLWWHVHSWDMHVGTCMYMIWTALGCLVHFVDSILWNGNTVNWAPVWCDISTHIQIGVAVAWPACGLWITRRLYNITVTITPAQKRRELIISLLITVGIPVLQMVAQYVVAGHRFNIYEDYGCGPATWNTGLAYVLLYSWPLIIALVSACYGALAVRATLKRRKESRGAITADAMSGHWRLIALASLDFCFTIPLATWAIVANTLWSRVNPWVSWDDTHWGYSRVFQFPRILVAQHPVLVISLETTRWAAVLCAFVFFGFFGFVDEAKKNYRLLASTIAKFFGYTKFTSATPVPNPDFSLDFASRVTDTQQDKSTGDSDKRSTSTENDEFDHEHKGSPYFLTGHSALSNLSNSHADEVPRIPDPVFDPTSPIRVTFAPDAYERA